MSDPVRPNLSLPAYLADPAISASDLNNARRSALKYRHEKDRPSPSTDAMVLGSAAHCAILEPHKFNAQYTVYTERRGTNKYKAFVAECDGMTVLDSKQWNACKRMAKAVREHPAAAPWLAEGVSEVSMFWANEDFGVDCKARLDWYRTGDAIIDIKTSRDCRPREFGRQAYSLGYHTKFAWYQDAVRFVTGMVLPVYCIVVESAQPHDIVVYHVDEYILQQGRDDYQEALHTLMDCRASGRYPGVSDEIRELELPAFAYAPDEEVTLTIGDSKVRV